MTVDICRFCYPCRTKAVELRECSFCNNHACENCRYCLDGAIGSRCCTLRPWTDKEIKAAMSKSITPATNTESGVWLRSPAYKARDENDHNTHRPDGQFWWIDITRKQQREIVSVKAQTRKEVNSLADTLEEVLYVEVKS